MKMHLRSEQKKYTRQSTLRHTEIVAYVSIGRGWFCVVPGHSGKKPFANLREGFEKNHLLYIPFQQGEQNFFIFLNILDHLEINIDWKRALVENSLLFLLFF